MSGGSVARRIRDAFTEYREETMKGLQTCLSICIEDPTEVAWRGDMRAEFVASFERFMEKSVYDESAWTKGMTETKDKFLAAADIVLAAQFGKVMETMSRVANVIADKDRQNTERERMKAYTQAKTQETLEQYMLLVNASFVIDRNRTYMQLPFEFMSGVEFPGLWSRSLYGDATPKKIYRNMLVGNRPQAWACDQEASDGWEMMLRNVRMVINKMIAQEDRGLLTEYATNLRYAENEVRHEDSLCWAPHQNGAANVDTWTVPGEEGFIKYDVRLDTLVLPRFMGRPCGAVFREGYIYVLTTEGEIFKVQLESCVMEGGNLVPQSLLHDRSKCIVEAPNRCRIQRVPFEKGTQNFPALKHVWDKTHYMGLMPTCLLNTPTGLLVVHCEYKAIWEVAVSGGTVGSRPGIKLHAGKPRVGLGVTQRERGKGNQTQDDVEFDEPRCAVLDGKQDLWVCDRDWLRKITYDKDDWSRSKFTVSNEVCLCGEFGTSMAMGMKGFVVLTHYWDGKDNTTYKPRLLDVQWINLNTKEGQFYKEIRKSSFIKNLGENDIGSIILDSIDQVVFCPRTSVRCVDRPPYVWGGPASSPFPFRENEEGTDDVQMIGLETGGNSTCHLTWYRSNIALFTQVQDAGPILVLLGKQHKRAAGGAADGDEAAREVSARTGAGGGQGADRPQTAPPGGRGRGRGRGSPHDLLLQLAELCV